MGGGSGEKLRVHEEKGTDGWCSSTASPPHQCPCERLCSTLPVYADNCAQFRYGTQNKGLMVPVVKAADTLYAPLVPGELRRPADEQTSQVLKDAFKAFINPTVDRNAEGWEAGGLDVRTQYPAIAPALCQHLEEDTDGVPPRSSSNRRGLVTAISNLSRLSSKPRASSAATSKLRHLPYVC